jgi:glutamyl-tRNA reductase
LIVELLVIGLSHQTAPLDVRERLAVIPAEMEARLQQLVLLPGVREVALLSTCNRVEIYVASAEARGVLGALRAHLRGAIVQGAGSEAIVLDRHLYERVGREAIHHLFRVASSLDSLVLGEPQILGQLKESFDHALRARTVGRVLGFVFPRAFRVARKVRRDTAIARQPVSVSSVAVDLARRVWSGFEGRPVLLVGAGKMSDLAARALRTNGARVTVTNRTAARAEELAARLGCDVAPFEDLEAALVRADIVITSTAARTPLLGVPLLERVQRARRWRSLVLIDIAVPRDVDPEVGQLGGIFLWDIDYLQEMAAQNLQDRRQEADRAEALVEEELASCLAAHRGHAVGPTITALRARYIAIARSETDKALAALPAGDERVRRVLAAMAQSIVAKLLHTPQVALKKAAASEEGEALLAAAYQLFGLEEPPASDEPPDLPPPPHAGELPLPEKIA